MEMMLFLAALAIFAIPVALIWLVFSHLALRENVRRLTTELTTLKSSNSPPAPVPANAAPQKMPTTLADYAVSPEPGQLTKPDQLAKPDRPPQTETPEATASPLPAEGAPATPPKSFVFDGEKIAQLFAWCKENWFIVVAAVSLAMAGIFLVQYGIENGVLSPTNRVLCALIFGAGLIGFGEWIRRRASDEHGVTAFLPSAFAGAGIVTLFSALLSAQQLYGLIGKEMAFGGLVGIAALAVLLGWLYGPLVSAIGLIGAVAVPFMVSDGTSENVTWLFYYFALISAVGLGVDAMKRSAWISSLGLLAPYIGAALIWMASGSEHFIVFAALIAIAAIVIPTVQLRPAFDGVMSSKWLLSNPASNWPEFPTRLAAAGILGLAGVSVLVSMGGEAGFWLALAALALTLFALGYWLNRTTVLDDLAIAVALAMLAVIGLSGLFGLDIATTITPSPDYGHSPPMLPTWLTAFGIGISALAGWRSLRDARNDLWWAAGAAIFAPATVILLALYWQPLASMGTTRWAAHVLAVSALMVVLAEQMVRVTNRLGDDSGTARLRLALFALAALNMIAFALSIVLTETALTLGFAGLAVSAAWLDRKFDIRPISWFVQGAIALCSYRLVADPGLPWALETSLIELSIGFLGTMALIAAAWWLLQHRKRESAMMVAESAIWSLGGIFVCLLLHRALDDNDVGTHWSLSLFSMILLISAAAQLYRAKVGGIVQLVRTALASIFATLGLLLLASAIALAPLARGIVLGPPIFDSLLVAYLLPALLLAGVAWRFDHLDKGMRFVAGGAALVSATVYVGLEIRRLWQGPDLTAPGVMDGELYTYTIAMLVVGSVVLGLALLKKSHALRTAAFTIIALTIAKVFLIDMSGLEGLTRVLSFLALGLVLAGLALLNRWVSQALGEA